MKTTSKPIIWFLVFIWCLFMGVTFVSFGLGALCPPINKIAQPFACRNGSMEYTASTSNPLPGTTVTQIGWYCVDSGSGVKSKMEDAPIHLIAGILYGLLMVAVAFPAWYYYTKGVPWVRKLVSVAGVIGLILLILLPMTPLIGLFAPKPAKAPAAAPSPLDLTYKQLTSKTTSDFSSTDKPIADWNGIPIMPQAIAGQKPADGMYTFKVPVDSGTIEAYYTDKLKSLGWTLADRRWQGMKFTKDRAVLLVTFAPATDAQSWIVTLVRSP